jgi:two-component system, NarL family, sensor histidine kinase UhpB
MSWAMSWKHRLDWKHWSMKARLLLIAAFPVLYLFVWMVGYSYSAHLSQANEELAERGRIVATALAQSNEAQISSGKLSDLKLTIHGLLQSDRSLYRIAILDSVERELMQVTSEYVNLAETRHFTVPVKKKLIWVGVVGPTSPALPAHTQAQGKDKVDHTIVGYVRVTMSPTNMLARQKQRFLFELSMAALALSVSAALAYSLSKNLTHSINDSMAALRQIRGGDYRVELAVTSGGELGELQASINEMAQSLQRATQDLENKVQARTRDLEASRNEALKANADKRKLIQKVHSVVEDERKSIAIEIHDELNASLIAARLESQRILQLATQMPDSAAVEEIRNKAQAIIKISRDLYASGRNLVRRLRPEVLDMLGLHGAVEEMVQHYDSTHADCDFEFDAKGDFGQLDIALAISAYRIIQEALSNVIKHAGAQRVRVGLRLVGGSLEIEVKDDGRGFDVDTAAAGIGLIGMRERVAGWNGEMRVSSAAGAGTTLQLSLPL